MATQTQGRWEIGGGTRTIQPGYTWENLSSGGGAAIFVNGGTVNGGGDENERAFFLNNFAADMGGALRVNSGAAEISHVVFTGNTALVTGGGAVYNNGCFLAVAEAVFSGNSASSGGAVNSCGGTVNIAGGSFSGNSASGDAGALRLSNAMTAISGTTFTGNIANGWGGAVYADGGTTGLNDVVFAGNKGNVGAFYNYSGQLNINGATFNGNISSGVGGAIRQGGTMNIGNVVFSGNSASTGGAVYNTGTVVITGLLTLTTETDTIYNEGVIKIDGSAFGEGAYHQVIDTDYYSTWSGISGSITVEGGYTSQKSGSNLYIKSTDTEKYNFSNAVLTSGGTASSVVIAGSTFSGVAYDLADQTLAADFGAVNYAYAYDTMTAQAHLEVGFGKIYALRNASFDNFSTPYGGAAVYNDGSLYLENISFTGNSAGSGGAIRQRGTMNIGNVVFNGNAAASGGALCNTGTVTITGLLTLTTETDTIYNEGVIKIDGSAFGEGAYHQVIDTDYYSTWSGISGSIAVEGDYTAQRSGNSLYIKSSDTEKYDFANAVFTAGGTASSVVIAGYTFSGVAYDLADQTLAADFGAVNYAYAYDTMTAQAHLEVGSGKIYALRNASFDKLHAPYGSAAVSNNGSLYLQTVSFTGNTGNGGAVIGSNAYSELYLADAFFSGNTAANVGGVLKMGTGAAAVIADTDFNDNISLNTGGVVYTEAGKIISMTDVRAKRNHGSEGGVIYAIGGTTAIDGGTFSFNTADTGGVLSQITGTAVFSDAVFAANTSGSEAGALRFSSVTAEICGSTFSGNIAGGMGSAIYADGGSLEVSGVIFAGNTGNSGAICNTAGTLMTVSGTTFSGNTAGHVGGAIRQRGTMTIGNVVFDGNHAVNGGGAIYNQGTIIVNGLLSLKQSTDGIVNDNVFKIDGSAFGEGAYHQVIDTDYYSTWSGISGSITVEGGYTSQKSGSDLYIKSTDTEKYNFSNAVLTSSGTASSVVIAGYTFSGVAYDLADQTLAADFGAVNYAYAYDTMTAQAHLEVGSGKIYALRNASFDNFSTPYGGAAVYNDGSLYLENISFTGNSAGSGGAIRQRGMMNIGNVVFNGNAAASGGALCNTGTVTITGLLTLKTETDTIYNEGVIKIDGAAFGDGAYYKVIDSAALDNWSGIWNSLTVTGGFAKASSGNNLYIKNNDANFTNAIFSADASVTQVVIGGTLFNGVGYSTSGTETEVSETKSLAADLGAANFIYSDGNFASSKNFYIGGTKSLNTDSLLALKNTLINGNAYGFDTGGGVNGNLEVLLEGATFNKAFYAGGTGVVNGDITVKVSGSTIGTNLSTTASAAVQHHGLVTIEVTNSVINGTLRGTGSDSHPTVDNVVISVTDSYAKEIIAGYGNPVSGTAAITLSGATIGTDIRRFGNGKANTIAGTAALTVTGGKVTTVNGSVLNMDTVTIDAGAELRLTADGELDGEVAGAGILTGSGALTFTGSTLGMGKLVNNGTITVNGKLADGTYTLFTYGSDWTLGAITAGVNGELYHNTAAQKYYYYNTFYVDSSLTGSEGQEVQITVDGKPAMAIYGVNAFTGSDAAKAAAAKTGKDFCIIIAKEEVAGNYYGNGNTKISGSIIGGNLYGQGETIISGGTIGKVAYGGKLIKGDDANAGDSSLTITGGTFAALAVGGGRVSVNGTSAAVTGGTAALNISGGSFASHLIAAGYVINTGDAGTASLNMTESNLTLANITSDKYAFGGAFVNNGTATVGTVNAAVTSGTYKSVFGGGWAQKGTSAVTTANIIVSGGSIHNLYAGGTDNGEGNAATVETANITISGGSVRNVFLNGKYSRDTVTTATLNVTGGTCEINWIEGLCHSMAGDSKSTVTTLNLSAERLNVEDILHVDSWNMTKVGSLLDFGTHTADLNGTTEAAVDTVIDFQIGEQSIGTDGWTAIAAKEFDGLGESSIKINSTLASYDSTKSAWTSGAYTVTLNNSYDDTRKALIVTKTA